MWASAQAADTQTAWQQVNAWRRTHDLLLHHAGRLKACADELSYAWPPSRSPAAQAFIAHITTLREAILRASADAATNYTAIAGVLTSLSAAKADMSRLMQEWDGFQNSDTAEKALRSAAGSPNSPEALNAKAQARMSQNDQEVLESFRQLQDLKPAPETTSIDDPPGSGPKGGDFSQRGAAAQFFNKSPLVGVTVPAVDLVDASSAQVGLAGSVTEQKPARVPDQVSPGSSSKPESSMFSASPGVIGRSPVAHPPSNESGRLPRQNFSAVGGSGGSGTTMSPAPVGNAGRGQGRVNPVGGVIEPGRPTTPMSAFPMAGGARGVAESERSRVTTPTMEWEVREGGPSVIEPGPVRPFELGPGVIGIDR